MQHLERQDTPDDFYYFRTSSPTYRKYLEKCGLALVDTGKKQYGWLKNVFGLFQVAKFERISEEPDLELLKKLGFKHGIVIWVPWKTVTIPKPWRRLMIPGSHFITTGFTTLTADYSKKWNDRAKRARKKFLANPDLSIKQVSSEVMAEAFLSTKVTHAFKKDYVRYLRSLCSVDESTVRCFLAYQGDKPVAGLAVHDSGATSVHLVAFTSREAKPLQAGTGLIDHWFSSSLEKGLKYIHFDHLKDPYMTSDQQGYTDFKLNFIEFMVQFKDSYFRFM